MDCRAPLHCARNDECFLFSDFSEHLSDFSGNSYPAFSFLELFILLLQTTSQSPPPSGSSPKTLTNFCEDLTSIFVSTQVVIFSPIEALYSLFMLDNQS
jgi:hypothetical protein